ncbi:Serine/threonine-protein kinase 40 [Orchesella cincta]|uniref:Serine/threonine-protein kinase 40 n=1 Tax=Orchesella cincta TaxID=48709 RepID=A0A1D2MVE9_ORCCI|nr:Serine/threonine-protein kinase 40 [Orchesella cincta]
MIMNEQCLLPAPMPKRKLRSSRKAPKAPKTTDNGRPKGNRKIGPVEPSTPPSVHESPPVKKIPVTKKVPIASASVKGQPSIIRRAGEYSLGSEVGNSPTTSITNYLARRDGTDDFFIIRMLTLKAANEKDTVDEIQGKSLLHTEHSLSSLLSNEKGIVHHNGMFRCKVDEIRVDENGETRTDQVWKLCLVLDCYMPHDFSPKYSKIISLQHYVIKQKKLPEAEAIRIFYKAIEIVDRLHKRNVVHRDLKLGSIILNRETGEEEVTLANFFIGKHLTGENDLLADQRGSPAYISPEIVIGKPYLGKPSDIWSMGITLYTMLFGQFPFYDTDPAGLFSRIQKGDFAIPSDVNVSKKTVEVIKSLLHLDPLKRPTASELLNDVRLIIQAEESLMPDSDLQVVPTSQSWVETPRKRTFKNRDLIPEITFSDIETLFAKEIEVEADESDNWEPYKNNAKRVLLRFPGKTGHITLDELQRFHAIGVARQVKEAASRGLLSITVVPEGATSYLEPTLNNDFAKCPAIELVPEICKPSSIGVGANSTGAI